MMVYESFVNKESVSKNRKVISMLGKILQERPFNALFSNCIFIISLNDLTKNLRIDESTFYIFK